MARNKYEDVLDKLTAFEKGNNAESGVYDPSNPQLFFHTAVPSNINLGYKNKEEEALFRAIEEREYQNVINILEKGNINVNTHQIDIETGGYDGSTPVKLALHYSDFQMCKILIIYGADFRGLTEYTAIILNKALNDGDKETVLNILDCHKLVEQGNIVIGGNSGLPLEEEFF